MIQQTACIDCDYRQDCWNAYSDAEARPGCQGYSDEGETNLATLVKAAQALASEIDGPLLPTTRPALRELFRELKLALAPFQEE